MIAAVLAGVATGYGIAIPVGAIGILLVDFAAGRSWRIGAAAALGVTTVDGLYALVAVVGGAAVARVISPVATPLRLVAGTVLIGLAARTVVSAIRCCRSPATGRVQRAAPTSPLRAYAGFLGLAMLNPTTVVYFAALVLGRRGDGTMPASASIAFVVAAFLASASWQLLLAGGGTLAGRLLTSRRGRLATASCPAR
jgi:arginine exporter protein ArgO